jgi:ribonuclease HI
MLESSDRLILFVDGSVDARSKIGYGGYLVISDSNIPLEELKKSVKVKRFENTSSTKLELQTLLWALSDIEPAARKVIVYTDSQNMVGLRGRRERLEKNDFRNSKNKRLTNYDLYQQFFRIIDSMDCDLFKVRGHLRAGQKDNIDRLFTLVDRASRKALRGE